MSIEQTSPYLSGTHRANIPKPSQRHRAGIPTQIPHRGNISFVTPSGDLHGTVVTILCHLRPPFPKRNWSFSGAAKPPLPFCGSSYYFYRISCMWGQNVTRNGGPLSAPRHRIRNRIVANIHSQRISAARTKICRFIRKTIRIR